MRNLPPLNSLRAFEVAGRRLSFRAAGEELGVTQAAVAQHVRQLEAHLGLTLFDRVPKGLAFTSVGRSYHARIVEVFRDLRDATAELVPEPEKVLISVTPTFAAKWLIPNLPDFTRTQPAIDLQILATEKVSSFHSDGIDLAVRLGSPPFGAALQAVRLFKQDIIAVAAPPLIGRAAGAHDIKTLAHLPKIHDTHDFWQKYLRAFDIPHQPHRGLRLSQTALAVDAAIAGQGVALVSRFLVQNDLDAGRLVVAGPTWDAGDHDFYLLSKRAALRSPAVQAVVAWLTARAGLVDRHTGAGQMTSARGSD